MSLITTVQTELLRRKGEWPGIAVNTGVSYSWLCKFAQGHMNNPAARRLERLHEYLEKQSTHQVLSDADR